MKKSKVLPLLALGAALLSTNVASTVFAEDITTYEKDSNHPDKYREVGSYSEPESTRVKRDTGITYYADGYVKGTAKAKYYKDDKKFELIHKEYVSFVRGVKIKHEYTSNVKEVVESEHNFKGGVEFPIKVVKADLGYEYVSKVTHVIEKGQKLNAEFDEPGEYVVNIYAVGKVYDITADWKAVKYPNNKTTVRDRHIGRITVPTEFRHTQVILDN
ncbi:hypothetical protein [Brevibacillus sp. VP]|uniref:hypothetical protein n=1 Tax=unclassified Brevibacillus TaxID=2684853 RepID=UPI000E2E8177|nr:hypothetical protein [Brevibacillus sp. VP]RFB28335.1 hypothetical protein DZB91_23675 [Brevibacillus sp. VP]